MRRHHSFYGCNLHFNQKSWTNIYCNISQNQFREWVVTEDIEYGSWQIVNFEVLLWRTGLITSDSHYYCYLEVICSIASKVDRCCCCDSGESNINELFVFKDTWDTPAVSPLAAWCSSSSRYVIQLNYDFIFVFFFRESDCKHMGLFCNNICHLPVCLLPASSLWLCINFKIKFLLLYVIDPVLFSVVLMTHTFFPLLFPYVDYVCNSSPPHRLSIRSSLSLVHLWTLH